MQSSYRIIKNTSAFDGKSRSIVTEYKPLAVEKNIEGETNTADEQKMKSMMDSYEVIAENILKNARKKSEDIMSQALIDAQIMKEDAYREGYDNGYEEGKQNGYKDAYDEEIVKAREEGKQIIESANDTVRAAKVEYEEYLKQKKDDIVNLAVSMARQILKREIDKFDGMDQSVLDALDNSIGSQNVIIRANALYVDSLKNRIKDYQYKFGEKCIINVLPDDNLEKGKVVIERDNGRVEIDIEKAIENILEIIN